MEHKGTKRLYWDLPLSKEFEAAILRFAFHEGKTGVVLDQTLFHPLGGGQPWDTGILSLRDEDLAFALGTKELKVTGVFEDGDEIMHLVEGIEGGKARELADRAPDGGWPALGRIDWDRRFDIMQQHTGQHILSRAFEEVLAARTVGFHLADSYVSIDLDIPDASAPNIAKVEDRANEIAFSNVPIEVWNCPKDMLPPNLRGRFEIDADTVRVICIGEFDACLCAGTHLTASGQVGLIKVNELDRAHGGLRIVFRCGVRALNDYRERQSLLDESARILSQKVQLVPSSIQAMQEKLITLQDDYERVEESLLELEIDSVLGRSQSEDAGGNCLVVEMPGRSIDKLKYAAKKIAEKSGKLTICYASVPRFSVAVVSLAPDGPDARKVLAAISEKWGGRGGGSREVAQLGSKEPLSQSGQAVVDSIKGICGGFSVR